jgi:Fe2+ or Zn2+ uptake regulation protein
MPSITRQTRQRAAILRVLEHTKQHPTAEWIHTEVRKEIPSVSLGTVYRLLSILAGEGAVRVIPLEAGPNRYDMGPDQHHHAVCTACGKIADIPDLVPPEARVEIERWTGYSLSELRLEWHGRCPECRGNDA